MPAAVTVLTTIFGERILGLALSALTSTPSRVQASHGTPHGPGLVVKTT